MLGSGCATVKNPTPDAYALIKAADYAYERSQWQEAEKFYLNVIDAVPSDAYAYFRLGNTYTRQHRFMEAIEAYRHALAIDPKLVKAYNNLAAVHLIQAERAIETALASFPDGGAAMPLLRLRHEQIKKLTSIPVDEKRGSGRTLRF